MTDPFFNLAHPQRLQWLWALLPLVVLFAMHLRWRERVVRVFVARSLLHEVAPRRSIRRPIVKFAVFLAGLVALVFAWAQPRWDPKEIEIQHPGQNLLFCLDVSNSMRARDVEPSRLEAAKASIRSLVSELPAGHQVGLLAYAGNAQLKCPLTPNYTHFLSELERLSYNSVDVGGSNLGDAIDRATRVFGLSETSARAATEDRKKPGAGETVMKGEAAEERTTPNVLIIFTDGESHEGYAKEMAVKAHRLGVAIYIIGLGSTAGAPIPIEENGRMTTLKFQDREVITRLDDASLRGIIEAIPSHRGYLPAGTSNVDLVDVYNRVISKEGGEQRPLRVTVWQEKFQLFAGIGTVLVLVSSLLSEQRPQRREEAARPRE